MQGQQLEGVADRAAGWVVGLLQGLPVAGNKRVGRCLRSCLPWAVYIHSQKLPDSLHMWTKMCVVAIDPANRTRIVCAQIGVLRLLRRAIRVLVSGGRIIISGGIRVLTSLLGLLVVPTVAASAAVLLALVALVVLV